MIKEQNSNSNNNHDKLGTKVLSVLCNEQTRKFTISELSQMINTNMNSLRVILSRLVQRGLILRIDRGLYKHNSIPEVTNVFNECEIKFHAIHLVCQDVTNEQGTLLLQLLKDTKESFGGPSQNNKIKYQLIIEEKRKVTFWISNNSIEVQIGASNKPLGPNELEKLLHYLNTNFQLNFENNIWQVVNIEINQDDRTINLNGLQSATLKDFDVLIQIYNKKGFGCRREVRFGNINLSHVLGWLKGDIPPGWGKVQHDLDLIGKGLKELRFQYRELRKQLDNFHLDVSDTRNVIGTLSVQISKLLDNKTKVQ